MLFIDKDFQKPFFLLEVEVYELHCGEHAEDQREPFDEYQYIEHALNDPDRIVLLLSEVYVIGAEHYHNLTQSQMLIKQSQLHELHIKLIPFFLVALNRPIVQEKYEAPNGKEGAVKV